MSDHRPTSAFREERERQGLRQLDIAVSAGCSVPLVSMTEAGYVPPLGTQDRLASALAATSGSFWPGRR